MMPTDLESLRRETADLLEETAINDLEDQLAEAQQRHKSRQQRLLEAVETTARNTSRRPERKRMSIAEKSQYIARYGQSAYLALPWQSR